MTSRRNDQPGLLSLIRRGIFKTVTGPRRYRASSGYDAERFWGDRFGKYGRSLRGSGHEGLSEESNRAQYEEAARIFLRAVQETGINLKEAAVLDIGCGPGFYTQLLRDQGVARYTGLDITDVLFDDLRSRFPGFTFVKSDATADRIEGRFDLIVMIDVIEHIVTPEQFQFAMTNIADALAPGGFAFIGPGLERPRPHLFYVRFWSIDEIKAALSRLAYRDRHEFRDGYLLVFSSPEQ